MFKTVNMYNSLFAYISEQTQQGIMFYSINYKVSDLLIKNECIEFFLNEYMPQTPI